MHELSATATDSAPDVIVIAETLCRNVVATILAVTEYRLFTKDSADGRTGGSVTRMVKDAIPAFFHSLSDIPINDVVACDLSLPKLRLTVTCLSSPSVFYTNGPPLLTVLTSLLDGPLASS